MQGVIIKIIVVFTTLITGTSYAQQDSQAFSEFLAGMPKPEPTLKAMLSANKSYHIIEKETGTAYQVINSRLSELYRPIYAAFQKLAVKPVGKLTKAEQDMLANYRQGARGLSSSVQFDLFKTLMAKRAIVGNGRPMWTPVPNNDKVGNAQMMSEQLKALEKTFDWADFYTAVEKYTLKFGEIDGTIDALNKKLTADMERLPKKKITIAPGFSQEMDDPEKAVALWEEHGEQKQKIFAQRYLPIYRWWNEQYQKLNAIATALDRFAQQPNEESGIEATKSRFMDLQIRAWEALYGLVAISQRLYSDTQIALASQQQIKEAVNMYKQLTTKE